MSNDHFDFAPYWLILEDAMRRDPVLESLMNDPDGRFTAQDWVTPDAAGTDTPSGHGSDKGIYLIKGNLEILLMFNDPEEQYSQYPTVNNYYLRLENKRHLRSVKLEQGIFEVLTTG